jgi:hypothetical protein
MAILTLHIPTSAHLRSLTPMVSGHHDVPHSYPRRICTGITSWQAAVLVLPIAHYHLHRHYFVASGILDVTHSHLRSICAGETL